MPLRITLCALAALLVTAGCSLEQQAKAVASDEDEKTATECLERLRKGDIATLEAKMDPSLKSPTLHPTLVRMTEMLPDGKPASVRLIGAQLNQFNDERTVNLTYEWGYGESRWFMVNCATKRVGDIETIVGLNVAARDKPYEEEPAPKVDLSGKSPLHYTVLILGITFVLLTVFALILCAVEKDLRRKWLWIVFILVGIGQFTLEWYSGAWSFLPLYFLLFSAGAGFPGHGVWEISIALPVGAIVYLVRRFLNHRRPGRSNPDSV